MTEEPSSDSLRTPGIESEHRAAWLSLDWDREPLVSGYIDRGEFLERYPGSNNWRHALAWARARTDDVRANFASGLLQLGPFTGSGLRPPEPSELALVEAAVDALVRLRRVLKDQDQDLERLRAEMEILRPSPQGAPRGSLRPRQDGRPWAYMSSEGIPDANQRIEVPAREPDRLAGVWGTALGTFEVTRQGPAVGLVRQHPLEGTTQFIFSAAERGGPPGLRIEVVVDDLEATLAALAEVGASIEMHSHDGATVMDPEGNRLLLRSA